MMADHLGDVGVGAGLGPGGGGLLGLQLRVAHRHGVDRLLQRLDARAQRLALGLQQPILVEHVVDRLVAVLAHQALALFHSKSTHSNSALSPPPIDGRNVAQHSQRSTSLLFQQLVKTRSSRMKSMKIPLKKKTR